MGAALFILSTSPSIRVCAPDSVRKPVRTQDECQSCLHRFRNGFYTVQRSTQPGKGSAVHPDVHSQPIVAMRRPRSEERILRWRMRSGGPTLLPRGSGV